MTGRRTFWLNAHLGYRCRHSGACCSSGWPIPIERDRAAAVVRDIAAGRVQPMVDPWVTRAVGTPQEFAGTLTLTDRGACTFYRPRQSGLSDAGPTPVPGACAIHHSKPSSCAHFPFVCLIDARGVRVTLSHYCPTAAGMLVDPRGPLDIVEGPPVFADGSTPEGLDAREVLPPLASPGRLAGLDEYSEWEARLVRSLAAAAGVPDPPLAARFEVARDALPATLSWPDPPAGLEQAWSELIAPRWPEVAPVAGRYLAARAFGSWVAYQGGGLPAVERSLLMVDAVFRVELARQARGVAPLGRAALTAAIRQSDLLLVHYVDPAEFARAC
jgi:Fe-S-cluster containining protein